VLQNITRGQGALQIEMLRRHAAVYTLGSGRGASPFAVAAGLECPPPATAARVS